MRQRFRAFPLTLFILTKLSLWSSACGASLQQGWDHVPQSAQRIALPSLVGEAIFFNVENLARRGTNRVLALVLDANIEIAPIHYSEVGLEKPVAIDEWGVTLDNFLLLNAGLFDANDRPLGLAKNNTTVLNQVLHRSWQGFVIGDGPIRIADLRFDASANTQSSKNIFQSMMLLDRGGNLRVRNSSLSACRSVIGQDAAGHIVIVLTEGAVTLFDLGVWLRDGPLKLTQALNLDGGHESQLFLRSPELEMTLVGRHGVNVSGGLSRPIPAVLAIRRVGS